MTPSNSKRRERRVKKMGEKKIEAREVQKGSRLKVMKVKA